MEDNGLKGLVALGSLLLLTYLLSYIQPKYNRVRIPEPCSWDPNLDTQYVCESAGCCWSQYHSGHSKGKWGCMKTCTPSGSGYDVKSIDANVSGKGQVVHLERSTTANVQGSGFQFLVANFTYETTTRLHVKIVPVSDIQERIPRWEVPESLIPRPRDEPVDAASTDYEVEAISEGDQFALRVLRKSTRHPIFDTGTRRLSFLDQYLEVSTVLARNSSMYGLGETTLSNGLQLPRFQGGTVITLWNLDHASADADVNLYGSHPFYLEVTPDGQSHGVLLLNSNGMDIFLSDTLLTYKALGGVLDFYFFMGPTPESVIQQYQQVIGKPAVPPAWSLGFHQCRWGYKTVGDLEQVLHNYVDAEIPLDVVWSDIDHMDRYHDFTLDPENFPQKDMADFIKNRLQKQHRHWVPIVDAGVAISSDYDAYKAGLRKGVFINDSSNKPLVAEVWPGPVHFPDFFNPVTNEWWRQQLAAFKETANYSGIWLDMNEASNFCPGEVCRLPAGWNVSGEKTYAFGNCKIQCSQPHWNDTLFYPKYHINNEDWHGPLMHKTLPMNAVHNGGYIEYNTHNLFGLTEAMATHKALANITGLRPFILTRSTFPSSGVWAAHWTGDNFASWDNLKWSIQGVLKSNLYGIPMAGADICGFMGETTEELCARWIAAGSFYTFVRNHNTLFASGQELYIWESVTAAARSALGLRYRLISYLLGQFVLANRYGGTVAKPVWFAYPADELARNTEMQWMLGEALLITPVVDLGLTTITAYFPAGTWYSAWDLTHLSGPANHTLMSPLEHVHVHIRAGTITPMQDTKMTVFDAVRTNVTLIITLDTTNYTHADFLPAYSQYPFCQQLREAAAGAALLNEKKKRTIGLHGSSATGASAAPVMFSANHVSFACGLLYLEDEASLDVNDGRNLEVWYAAASRPAGDAGNITAQVQYNRLSSTTLKNLVIERVVVLGVGKLKQGHHYAAVLDSKQDKPPTVRFRARSNKLDINNLQIPVTANFTLRWEVRSGDANGAASLTGARRYCIALLASVWGAALLLAALWW